MNAAVCSTSGMIMTGGKTEIFGEQSIPVVRGLPQISQGLAWDWKWA